MCISQCMQCASVSVLVGVSVSVWSVFRSVCQSVCQSGCWLVCWSAIGMLVSVCWSGCRSACVSQCISRSIYLNASFIPLFCLRLRAGQLKVGGGDGDNARVSLRTRHIVIQGRTTHQSVQLMRRNWQSFSNTVYYCESESTHSHILISTKVQFTIVTFTYSYKVY